MNTAMPAYRRQPTAVRTGSAVPAIGYAARTGWLNENQRHASPPKPTWSMAEPEVKSAAPPESNILLLNPSALDDDGRAMLERLSALALQLPMAALGECRTDGFPATLDENAQKHLIERLHAIASILKSHDTAPLDTISTARMIEHGGLRLDFKTCRAYWRDAPVNLTITEFNIVRLFASRIGENLSYREIYDVVHGIGFCAGDGTHGYQTNVRSLIKRIRQKFYAVDHGFDAIENHRGYGYRWCDQGEASPPVITESDMSTECAPVLMVYVMNQATP